MAEHTGIAYCHHSWGPWRGCHPIANGCQACYAAREMKRYGHDHSVVVRAAGHTFTMPLRWNREAKSAGERRRVFVTPWSDFWITEADEWREEAFDIIESCDGLDFVSPSKRLHRAERKILPDNLWVLASVSDSCDLRRANEVLPNLDAKVVGISYEPALAPLDFSDLGRTKIQWLIAGSESKSHTAPGRPSSAEWFRWARDWCEINGVPFYLKQMEIDGKLVHAPTLDGRTHREIP